MNNIHICTFSSSLSDIPKKELSLKRVLAHLEQNPRFSSFDIPVNGKMPGIITDLFQDGYIVDTKKNGYPWIGVKITRKGLDLLGLKTSPNAQK